MLEGIKKFAGEIIGIILIMIFWSLFPGLRNIYRKLKKGDNEDADVMHELSEIKRQLEAQRQEKERPSDPQNSYEI